MTELNPNHPVTRATHDHWHKIAALLLQKLGGSAVITVKEIEELHGNAITIQELADGVHVNLIPGDQAEAIARMAGGLPT